MQRALVNTGPGLSVAVFQAAAWFGQHLMGRQPVHAGGALA